MQGSKQRGRLKDERGASLVLMATGVLMSLLGITGLVIDLGMARRERGGLQSMVDAASLAGSQSLDINLADGGKATAISTAATYAGKNLDKPVLALPSCPAGAEALSQCYTVGAVSLQVTPRMAEPGEPYTRLYVKACEDVDTSFMKVFGWDHVTVCTDSTAKRVRKGLPPVPPGILVLGKAKEEVAGKKGTHKALHTHGYIEVKGWSGHPSLIQIDSKHATQAALVHDRKSVTIADQIRVVGATQVKSGATVCQAGQVLPPFLCLQSGAGSGITALGDPLFDLEEPPGVPSGFPGETKASDKTTTLKCPGPNSVAASPNVCVYGKLKAENGGELRLEGPGVFIANGLEVKGRKNDAKPSQIVVDKNKPAMIFNVGKIIVNDGGELHLQAMSLTQAKSIGFPDYADIALFQARCRAKDINNPEKCDALNAKGQKILLKTKKKTNGQSGSFTFGGTLYAANSKLEIKGFAEDEDPPAMEDIDEDNDVNEPDDLDPLDEEAGFDFQRSAIIVGELVVGKKGKLVVDTQWPYAAGYLNPTSTLIE